MKHKLGRKRKLTSEQSRLLRRIERISRTATVLRLRGDVDRAMQYDRTLNSLFRDAEEDHLSGAATERERRGQQRADKLYRKSGGNFR